MKKTQKPGKKARQIYLSDKSRRELEKVIRSHKSEHRLVVRAKIILLSCSGLDNISISNKLSIEEKTVRKWRIRYNDDDCLKSLRDLPRSGRPQVIEPWTRCTLIKIACERVNNEIVPFRDVWTYKGLQEALYRLTGEQISLSEIGYILRSNELRPHKVRYWLHSQDEDFEAKVKAICNLYLNQPENSVVLSIDEKTGMQAIERKYSLHQSPYDASVRKEYEYIRHGTQTLMSSFNVHTGHVFAQCGKTRKAEDLVNFMESLANYYPDQRICVIWDNLNTHKGERWKAFNERHNGRFSFYYTPLHASWVNQIEIWFSILAKRILLNGSFTSEQELTEKVLGFIQYWNTIECHPFNWTFRGQFKRKSAKLVA